jgi:hypothetical protein
MVLMGYSGARGTLIYEKNLMLKISCQTPFYKTIWPLSVLKLAYHFELRPFLCRLSLRGPDHEKDQKNPVQLHGNTPRTGYLTTSF